MWTPGYGYLWVSGYPWGYMPFQCGAWNFYDGFGWGWAPGMGGCRPWWGMGFYGGPNLRPCAAWISTDPAPDFAAASHQLKTGGDGCREPERGVRGFHAAGARQEHAGDHRGKHRAGASSAAIAAGVSIIRRRLREEIRRSRESPTPQSAGRRHRIGPATAAAVPAGRCPRRARASQQPAGAKLRSRSAPPPAERFEQRRPTHSSSGRRLLAPERRLFRRRWRIAWRRRWRRWWRRWRRWWLARRWWRWWRRRRPSLRQLFAGRNLNSIRCTTLPRLRGAFCIGERLAGRGDESAYLSAFWRRIPSRRLVV